MMIAGGKMMEDNDYWGADPNRPATQGVGAPRNLDESMILD